MIVKSSPEISVLVVPLSDGSDPSRRWYTRLRRRAFPGTTSWWEAKNFSPRFRKIKEGRNLSPYCDRIVVMSKVRGRPTLYASLEHHAKTPCSSPKDYPPLVSLHHGVDRYKGLNMQMYVQALRLDYSLSSHLDPNGEESLDENGRQSLLDNGWTCGREIGDL